MLQFDYDKKQTQKNVKDFLRYGRKIRNMYQSSLSIRSSSNYSFAPSYGNGGHSDRVERAAMIRIEAQEEWKEIEAALNLMNDLNYYRLVPKALEEFAFCYRGGELIAWI